MSQRLRELGLAHNNVGAAGARALAESAAATRSALASVAVGGSGVGSKWQYQLQRALQRNAGRGRTPCEGVG